VVGRWWGGGGEEVGRWGGGGEEVGRWEEFLGEQGPQLVPPQHPCVELSHRRVGSLTLTELIKACI
jgi:hypothetical protein